ncbi:hypothetical protein TOPH_03256 [Tolypocladium ophioglossoides CBS 100239]|uniref:Vacuolar ATPase assembly protein VMA22 n=1 Tax=Tolypocladium ophioglossoides (strain CBS 100239) TaxID=1163406 RepID=A0A0L0NEB5_TOLOC|nr:hypothetical protein TOPH_03256 [Tolypocladium ophioglossoides CBS 100239]
MAAEQQHIDELLERYLGLVDEYTQLRRELSQLQADVYQNIARANFSAERGLRYGRDQYDERMQATRVVGVSVDASDVPTFTVSTATATADAATGTEDERQREDGKEEAPGARDPLRWFGLLAPMPLRKAQGLSAEAVERVVPRLVSVSAEMGGVEIEVRRARKRRAKALAAERKNGDAVKMEGTEGQVRSEAVEASR